MRPFVFAVVLLCWSDLVLARTDYYPGMVHLVTDTYILTGPANEPDELVSNTVVFRFCKQPLDSSAVRELSFYLDHKIRVWEDDYATWFCPMSLDTSGDFNIYMTCKSQRGDWLEVIVNEKTKETLWIKNTLFVQFMDWKKLIRKNEWLTVSANTRMYVQPDTSSGQFTPMANCFQIDKIKGDWMLVGNYNSELCECQETNRQKAWVRFRTPEALLINIKIQI